MSQIVIHEWQPSDSQRSDRSAGDRSRHRFKVREAIRDNIADIVAEESIIGQSRDRIVKIPIRGIKEYRFVFGDNAPGVAIQPEVQSHGLNPLHPAFQVSQGVILHATGLSRFRNSLKAGQTSSFLLIRIDL